MSTPAPDSTSIEFVPSIGRRARTDSWEDQKVSTYRRIREAVAEERWDDAARLTNYFVDEGRVCFGIYRQWIPDLNAFLRENGVSPEDLAEVNAQIVAKLALPDGSPWDPYEQWDRFLTAVECDGQGRPPPGRRADARADRRGQGDVASMP